MAETVQHIQNRGIRLFFSCSYGLDLNVISTPRSSRILTPAACSVLYASSSSAQSVNVRLYTIKDSDYSLTLPQADPFLNIWRFRKVIFLKEAFFYDVNKQKKVFLLHVFIQKSQHYSTKNLTLYTSRLIWREIQWWEVSHSEAQGQFLQKYLILLSGKSTKWVHGIFKSTLLMSA